MLLPASPPLVFDDIFVDVVAAALVVDDENDDILERISEDPRRTMMLDEEVVLRCWNARQQVMSFPPLLLPLDTMRMAVVRV